MTLFNPSIADPAAETSTEAGNVAAYARKYNAEWIECPDCGLFQALPPRRGRFDRVCVRCHSSFGSGSVRLNVLLAISVASMLVLLGANLAPLLGIYIEGQHSTVTIAASAEGLFKQNMHALALFVLGLTVIMPALHLSLQSFTLFCLWRGWRPPRLARVFLWAERVLPWAMLDVFLLGIFITVSKLREMAQVQLLHGLWALGILVALFVAFSACVDRQKIWDLILPPPVPGPSARHRHWASCLSCNMLHEIKGGHLARGLGCVRCGTKLHFRKPASIQRTWALVIAGYILYIPANLYPVMTVIALGREQPTTIMEGVRQLWNGNDWPYAILVFAASIFIPLLKLMGLTAFLLTYHLRHKPYLVHSTRLYRIFEKIGRWSSLDIFVAAVLGALVSFNNLATITPGPGIMPFAAVVVLTMLAVAAFDPRLMWDATGDQND